MNMDIKIETYFCKEVNRWITVRADQTDLFASGRTEDLSIKNFWYFFPDGKIDWSKVQVIEVN